MTSVSKRKKRVTKRASRNAPVEPAELPQSWRQEFLRSGATAVYGVCTDGKQRTYSFSSPKQNRPHVILRGVTSGDFELPEVLFSDITSQPRQFQAAIMFNLAYRVRAGRNVAVVERHPRCPHRVTDRATMRLTYKADTSLKRFIDIIESAYERDALSELSSLDRMYLRDFIEERKEQRRRDQVATEDPT